MKLTQENIKVLSHCAENKIRVVVSGKNAMGQDFTTEGYIMPGLTSNGQPNWIREYGFALFVGQTRQDREGNNIKQFVPLYSYAKNNEYDEDKLYIQFVKEKNSGKVLFTNLDFSFILNTSLTTQNRKGWSHTVLTDYGKKLVSLIGKPVIYHGGMDEERLVLKTVFNNGSTYANATTGQIYRGLPLLEEGEINIDKKAYEELDMYGATAPQQEIDM